MPVSRRSLLQGSLLAAAPIVLPSIARAQDGTPAASPEAAPLDTPGYALIRARSVATPQLGEALFADLMHRYVPLLEALPGFEGYLFAYESEDPSHLLSMTFLGTMEDGVSADAVAQEYIAGLDPRLQPETQLAEQGPIRVYATTDRPVADLPPLLAGCAVTTRNRANAPETDIEAILQVVSDELLPELSAMDGFIFYGWMMRPEGRVSFNIWETAEQLAAGDAFIADWVAAHPIITSSGETEVHAGTIAYADVLGSA